MIQVENKHNTQAFFRHHNCINSNYKNGEFKLTINMKNCHIKDY